MKMIAMLIVAMGLMMKMEKNVIVTRLIEISMTVNLTRKMMVNCLVSLSCI